VNVTIPSIVFILPALVAWFAGIPMLRRVGAVELTSSRYGLLSAFFIYVLGVIHFTVFPIHVHTGEWKETARIFQSVNIVPFRYLNITDFVLNILLMIPLGVFLPAIVRRADSLVLMCLVAVFVGGTLEGNQYLLRLTVANDRNVNINDVIANATGVVAGYVVFRFVLRATAVRRSLDTQLLA
jgi:glycopeptide antibiotics resistance protein